MASANDIHRRTEPVPHLLCGVRQEILMQFESCKEQVRSCLVQFRIEPRSAHLAVVPHPAPTGITCSEATSVADAFRS